MAKSKKTNAGKLELESGDLSPANKTKAVKDYLKQHRGALPMAVSEALKAQGIDVAPKYVSNIKFQMGIKKRGKKAAESTAEPETAAPEAKPADDDQISLSALLEAKKLIEKLGSADAAKRAIIALAQLSR